MCTAPPTDFSRRDQVPDGTRCIARLIEVPGELRGDFSRPFAEGAFEPLSALAQDVGEEIERDLTKAEASS